MYGRFFALWTGISGIVASAVLVGMTTDKLTMTRREKMINKVLYNENLRLEISHFLEPEKKTKLSPKLTSLILLF